MLLQYGLSTLCLVAAASAAYSSSAGAGAGSFAGSFGSGTGGGFTTGGGVYGNQVNNGYGDKFPYNTGAFFGASTGTNNLPNQFPFPGQNFNFAHNFWNNFNQQLQSLYNQQLNHQQALYHQFSNLKPGSTGGTYGFTGTYGGSTGGGGGSGGPYAPNFAGSTASFGPGGFHQSATIIPANPNSPNVDTRFGDNKPVVTVSSGPPGFHGVSTSSFSSSSDVNGQKTNHREAVTSVNDNGRVTTYHVRS